jgi:ribosomal protein S18 acetylase RimI-like enzyme
MSVRDSVCIRKLEIPSQKREVSRRILADLGEWFGIPDATESYIDRSSTLPFWAAFDGAVPVGFIAVRRHFDKAAEIYVMGVMKAYHRRGIGNLLLDEAEKWCAHQGVAFLQVKTLSASHPDPNYAKTRQFYRSVGFLELEEFPQLWGSENPCLLMVKAISAKTGIPAGL